MKASTSLVSRVLLALVLGASSIPVAATGRRQPTAPDSRQHEMAWQVGQPAIFENLSVYPVLLPHSTTRDRFITLDEGLKTRKVIVSEIGATGRLQRLRAGQEVSEDAEVNRLLVTNRSGKTLILIAGELVVGGKQDRMVGHDCLIEASAKPVPIDVFCVEHGRWNEDSSFGRTRADTIDTDSSIAVSNRRHRRGSHYNLGGGNGSWSGRDGTPSGLAPSGNARADMIVISAPAPLVSSGYFTSSDGAMAAPNVREKAQALKDQSAVWTEVAKAETANNTNSETGTLNVVFKDENVRTRLDAYQRALGSMLPGNSVGIVAAINGELVSADVFGSASLFRAYWPKLLRSLALQASSEPKEDKARPGIDEARAFLTHRADRIERVAAKQLYKLVERKSDAAESFELSTSRKARGIIHLNKVARQ
jgi:hypothetical protein